MEKVSVIAKQTFVNGLTGAVSRKQELFIPLAYAEHLYGLGLVDYKDNKVEQSLKKSNPSLNVPEDGQEVQSASLPVETASQKDKSENVNKGKNKKTGK